MKIPPLALLLMLSLAATLAQAQSGNDPMRPPGQREAHAQSAKPVVTRYRLDSVIIAPGRRLAMINGRRLAQGEWLGRAQLLDIRATEVTLRIDGQTHVLTLLPMSIKKPSSEAMRQ
jgi:hypothetical protein